MKIGAPSQACRHKKFWAVVIRLILVLAALGAVAVGLAPLLWAASLYVHSLHMTYAEVSLPVIPPVMCCPYL
jgi:hypothetical protein